MQLRLSLRRKFLTTFVTISSLFFSLLPIFGGRRLWHNASASGGSSNTLLWPKYSSVARWLAKRRSRSGGGGGAGLGWCGTATSYHTVSAEAPLKFKYLSELEIDPLLWLSLPACCHSSVTPLLNFLPPVSLHFFHLDFRKEKKEQRREQCKKRDRKHQRTKREESKAHSSILNQSCGTKTFFFLVVPHDNPAQPPQLWTHLPSQIYPGARNSCRLSSHTARLLPPSPH